MKRRSKKSFTIIISLCTIYLIGLAIYLFIIKENTDEIVLNGDSEVVVKVNTTYQDKGAIVHSKNVSDDAVIIIDNPVNIKKLGEYEVTYTYGNLTAKRKVKVVDDIAPVITLNGDNPAYYCSSKEYLEEGYKVTDNYDQDLSDKVKITKENGYIKYEVTDSSSNYTSITRELLEGDKTPPVITLTGGDNITIYQGSSYKDNYKAIDNCDGDLTSQVEVTGEVDSNKLGAYELIYKVTDKSGNTTQVTRRVTVSSNVPTIYLTFDDGPSSNATPYILDILKKYDVKATFFVLNHDATTDYLIKREFNEGHTVGYHGYSHSYKTVYASDDGFMDNIKKIEDKVVNLIGTSSKLIRFPGGSSNTVSKNYNKGIMSRLVERVEEEGYNYQDWNVDCNDTGTQDSEKICQNVIDGLHGKTNVVLMHDASGKMGSAKAVECIIEYGLSHGYQFKNITAETPLVHHPVNN